MQIALLGTISSIRLFYILHASNTLITRRTHHLPWQQANRHRTHKGTRARHIQHPIKARLQDPRRNQRSDDTEDAAPEARHAGRGAADRGWEWLGRPAVKDGVEHGLEEVLEPVDADVLLLGLDDGEDEEGGALQGGGEDHGGLAALVHEDAEEDAGDAEEVDVDLGTAWLAGSFGCLLQAKALLQTGCK